jgi:endonuclease/exonuclease/phosphatase family metal-dependent hydrolase
VPLVVRTWNLFHGNAVPPERHAYLERMVRLVTADAPGVVLLQELPVWALGRLAGWSGMQAFDAVGARPRLRSARLGKVLTGVHHGLLRSAVTGQANAILVAQGLTVVEHRCSIVSGPGEGERRVCQALRIGTLGAVANVHLTPAFAEQQLGRALRELDASAQLVLGGDLNLRPGEGKIYDDLRARGFSAPAPGIDQILVRGLPATPPLVWPEDRRRSDGRLLSDHAPVELTVG